MFLTAQYQLSKAMVLLEFLRRQQMTVGFNQVAKQLLQMSFVIAQTSSQTNSNETYDAPIARYLSASPAAAE